MAAASVHRRGRALSCVLLLALVGVSLAQPAASARLEVGVGAQVVVGAWNPVRFVSRDTPPATLTVVIDQGSLRQGEIPLVLQHEVGGGAGLTVFETLAYLGSFSSIGWTLRTADAVIASGSLAGRDIDERPLDLVISREAGRFRTAYGPAARIVELPAASLPLDSAAYSGVRSLLIDGTAAAPRLEAVAAAAAGGALVVIAESLPASHAELELLAAPGEEVRLGAGRVARARGSDVGTLAATALASADAVSIDDLVEALTSLPMVERPATAPQPLVLAVAAAFALLCVTALRAFGGPGLVSALAVAGVLSFTAWRALRPPDPQLLGAGRIAVGGGELALVVEAQEHLTLPPSEVVVPGGARPLTPVPHSVDASGAHFQLARWRSLVVALPPQVTDSPLRVSGDPRANGVIHNAGQVPLFNVQVVGVGAQGRLEPGASLVPRPQELSAAATAVYRRIEELLPPGSTIATSCAGLCTVWVVTAAPEGEVSQ